MPAPVPAPFNYDGGSSNSHDEEDQIIDWGDGDEVPDWDLGAQFTDSDYYSDYYDEEEYGDDEESEWESDWESDNDEANGPPRQHPAITHAQQNLDSLRSTLEKLEGEQELALRCSFNGPPYRDASDEALMEWADLDQWLDEYEAKKEQVLRQAIEAEQELIVLMMKVEGQEGEVDMLDPRRVATCKVKYGVEEEEPAGSQEEDLQRRFENVKRFARGIYSWGNENHRPPRQARP